MHSYTGQLFKGCRKRLKAFWPCFALQTRARATTPHAITPVPRAYPPARQRLWVIAPSDIILIELWACPMPWLNTMPTSEGVCGNGNGFKQQDVWMLWKGLHVVAVAWLVWQIWTGNVCMWTNAWVSGQGSPDSGLLLSPPYPHSPTPPLRLRSVKMEQRKLNDQANSLVDLAKVGMQDVHLLIKRVWRGVMIMQGWLFLHIPPSQ